ncbi:hypothetical protein OKW30_001397 [Paraburkholderia sp. Clong3]|uniref:hypothetical protein n=1 Tax=Paraburkholderia sp. Clong3 TaxID=2991061 RepID=UPI003D1A791A
MRELFEHAAFRAGLTAARRGVPFHENPLNPGPLSRFARQCEQGWSVVVESMCDQEQLRQPDLVLEVV